MMKEECIVERFAITKSKALGMQSENLAQSLTVWEESEFAVSHRARQI